MQDEQRHGSDLDKWLTRLSGWEGNNPLNAPGVPHIPWVHARTRLKLQPDWEQKKKRMHHPYNHADLHAVKCCTGPAQEV